MEKAKELLRCLLLLLGLIACCVGDQLVVRIVASVH